MSKMHIVRDDNGNMIEKIDSRFLAKVLDGLDSGEIFVKNGKYILDVTDGCVVAADCIRMFLWKNYTIDCLPSEN